MLCNQSTMSDATVAWEHDFSARQAHILVILDKEFPGNLRSDSRSQEEAKWNAITETS